MFRTEGRNSFVFLILVSLLAIATNSALGQIDGMFRNGNVLDAASVPESQGVGNISSASRPELAVKPLIGEPQLSNASAFASKSARHKVIMSVVLDRSGSMTLNGGATAIGSAVPTFINQFDNSLDEVALISFSGNATIDFPMGHGFTTSIASAVASMHFGGGTFGTGAGSQPVLSPSMGAPLSLADLQNNSVVIKRRQRKKVSKVLVYFTDGLMNTVQDNFYCGVSAPSVLINYGGYDAGRVVGFFDPVSPMTIWGTCLNACARGFPYDSTRAICKNAQGLPVTTFLSQQTGQQTPFTRGNVTAESQYRAIYTANAMRSERPVPTYIYIIGLGASVSPPTQAFLAQLANDPRYPTYIPRQPAGEFFYIPDCPSPACTTELNAAFQGIASKLLHR